MLVGGTTFARHRVAYLLAAVVYFNDREVYPWPENYGLPNWRVAREAAE